MRGISSYSAGAVGGTFPGVVPSSLPPEVAEADEEEPVNFWTSDWGLVKYCGEGSVSVMGRMDEWVD